MRHDGRGYFASNLGIGTTTPATLLEVGGSTANVTFDGYKNCTGFTSNANGLLACTASDQRLKTDIASLDGASALSGLNALNPVSFYWDPATERGAAQQYGLVAQEVQTVFPNLVATSSPTVLTPDGTLSINYEGLISPMILAIQTLDARTKFIQSATTSPIVIVDASGKVGIGTTTPNHTLTVAGDIGAIAFVNTSTRDAKTNISYVTASSSEDMLKELVNLKVATYRYKIEGQNDPLRLGFIAEEAQTVAPEVLSPDGKGIDLYKLATFTLAGVQALAAKVDAQETRITSLEDRMIKLESGAVSTASGSPISLSTSSLASALESFGGVLHIGKFLSDTFYAARGFVDSLTAANVTVGTSAAPTGVTLYDTVTKEPYCFSVAGGAPTTTPGICGQTAENLNPFATSTISIATTTGAFSINLIGANPTYLSVGGVYAEEGATISGGSGPYDIFVNGNATATSSPWLDTSVPTTYILTYSTTDSAGNSISTHRSVIVGNPDGTVSTGVTASSTTSTTASSTPASSDTTAPAVTLSGAATMEIAEGGVFIDPGATAADDVDGDLTTSIVVTGSVTTATAGTYTLTYSATDAALNTGSASRTVTVVAPSAIVTTTATATTTTATSTAP